QTTRIWLKTASRLAAYEDMLLNEIHVVQREMTDIAAATECRNLLAAGHIRRAHTAMSFPRLHAAAHPEGPSAAPICLSQSPYGTQTFLISTARRKKSSSRAASPAQSGARPPLVHTRLRLAADSRSTVAQSWVSPTHQRASTSSCFASTAASS